jgi:ABC-type lipoprotein export system ATPase subunit
LAESLIDLRGVVKSFRGPAGTFTALKGVDLRVGAGEFVAVIGKSGSGKSTLINMITGIDRPTAGEVVVDGVAVHRLDERRLARWRGRTIGIVFQFFQLLPTLTLLENVMLPMDFCRVGAPRRRAARAMRLLELVGLSAQAHQLPQAVSGGQQQRAAIARALANDPPILIADEPTGNLDSHTADQVFDLFRRLVAHGKTVVMVTHDNDFAHRVSRAVIVADGQVVNEYVAQALSTLDLDQMTLVQEHLSPQAYPPGTVLFRQGDPADRFYVVVRGSVEVLIDRPGGQPVIVNRLSAGRYFGEVGLLSGGRRTATVRSSIDEGVELMALDAETFRTLIADSEPTREAIEEMLGQYVALRPDTSGPT